jgi:hypothetical protein
MFEERAQVGSRSTDHVARVMLANQSIERFVDPRGALRSRR